MTSPAPLILGRQCSMIYTSNFHDVMTMMMSAGVPGPTHDRIGIVPENQGKGFLILSHKQVYINACSI